jgi:hypothetical protein
MALQPARRPDISNALVHLTRERIEPPKDPYKPPPIIPAFSVLKEILASGIIRGSGNEGFVKGTRRAVCLSEIPLANIELFARRLDEKGRYRYYGIILSKRTVFAIGGRPVIYLPDAEGDWIPLDQKWRHVRFEYDAVDFTHEREWRVPDDIDLKKVPGLAVIVWSALERAELLIMNGPLKDLIRSILPMEHLLDMI